MKKNFKSVKASLIMGILLVSLSAAFITSSSASGLGIFRLTPNLQFSYDPTNAYNIVPADPNGSNIALYIQYQITGIFAETATKRFGTNGINAKVQITVGSVPNYCSVDLPNQDVDIEISNKYVKADPVPMLHVTFSENAPMTQRVGIPIHLKATVSPAFPWSVDLIEEDYSVWVSPAYIPLINVIPTNNFIETSPGEKATVGIECQNQGNQLTEVRYDVIEKPEGWSVGIIASTKISPNAKETVNLDIRPSYAFGWHDEQSDVVIRVQGFYYASESGKMTSSRAYDIIVTVRNKGFSMSGFEPVLLVLVILVLVLIGVFFVIKRWKKTK
ncbi:MAG: hypothetical protein NTV74_00260 [Euryarchaeota archaeon]|nr:hypothetical protein [Euryarchaeota archaeon]